MYKSLKKHFINLPDGLFMNETVFTLSFFTEICIHIYFLIAYLTVPL